MSKDFRLKKVRDIFGELSRDKVLQSCARLYGDKDWTQCELMIRRVQFIRRSKEAATQAACDGNTRGYHSEYGN